MRCGYSLTRIADARNCPECGLAVRITLAGNSGLEWSSPGWQRFMAFAFGVLAFGSLCKVVASAADLTLRLALRDLHRLTTKVFLVLYWTRRVPNDAWPIITGIALCLLAKHERRYPDRSRISRRLTLAAGIGLLMLSVLHLIVVQLEDGPTIAWVRYYLWRTLLPPWPQVVIAILSCAMSLEFARRGHSRWLKKLSQLPLWAAAAGTVIWFFDLDQFSWWLRTIVWDWLFPLSIISMSILTIHVLRVSAREATANWVSDA